MKAKKKFLVLGLVLGVGCGIGFVKNENVLSYKPVKVSYAAEEVNINVIKQIKDNIEKIRIKIAAIEFIKESMPETAKKHEKVINQALKDAKVSVDKAQAYLKKIEGEIEKPEDSDSKYTKDQAAAIAKAKEINKEIPYSRFYMEDELKKFFKNEDAEFAAANAGIDYNDNAYRSSKIIFDTESLSKKELINKLTGSGYYYNESEAAYAANKYDKEFWIQQAVEKGKSAYWYYVRDGEKDNLRSGLVGAYGFTKDEAKIAVERIFE